LPVLDTIAADYDDVRFVAVAGRSDYEQTAARAEQLFSRLDWGLDDAIWRLYDVPYQPVSMVVADGVIADRWEGVLPEAEIRARLDAVLATT
jgi:hypothetical protein